MKRIIFIMAAALSLVACNQNTPDDTKKGGDTPTFQHQPSDPASWSPVGKTYILDIAPEAEPDTVRWFVFCTIPELGEDSTRGLQLHYQAKHVSSGYTIYSYELNYPKLSLIRYGEKPLYASFQDTLTLVWNGDTYTCN